MKINPNLDPTKCLDCGRKMAPRWYVSSLLKGVQHGLYCDECLDPKISGYYYTYDAAMLALVKRGL